MGIKLSLQNNSNCKIILILLFALISLGNFKYALQLSATTYNAYASKDIVPFNAIMFDMEELIEKITEIKCPDYFIQNLQKFNKSRYRNDQITLKNLLVSNINDLLLFCMKFLE